MRLRLLLPALLACVAVAGPALAAEAAPGTATTTIGDARIALPIPPEFAAPSATPKLLVDPMAKALPPSNRLLAVMVRTEWLERIAAGETQVPLSRFMGVQTFPALEQNGISPAAFDQVKATLRTQSAQLLEQVKGDLVAANDRLSTEVGKMTGDVSTRIRTSDASTLGIFDEQPDSISMAALQTVSGSATGNSIKTRQAMALAAIRLRGKLLMVTFYSNYESQADVDWVEGQARDWVRRLHELNP